MEGDLARHKRISHKPTPDWRGGAAVATRQWRRKPEPRKAGQNKNLTGHVVPGTVKFKLSSKKNLKKSDTFYNLACIINNEVIK